MGALKKAAWVFASVIMLLALFTCAVFAADSAFEKSIAAFPESYRVSLRALHEKYPDWTFEALDTGLDWNTVVMNESTRDRNLVPSSSIYSDLLKSKAAGDYNASTGTYIQKDSGWVSANELAVAYFMDPRNALTASCVFQFEALSFSENCTIETIENVLYGSFMYDSVIKYYNASGKLITTNQKYSEVIYTAGKTHNINPSYIASKILNEIGLSGSSSVSGTYSGYEGIFNFYNIGATDGSGAIGRGLKWASTSTTYSRPWNTPYKSIIGGAEFLAQQYISEGQFTGYLQKFQVNPNSSYDLYDHQYMTNVAGANTQGYTTYQSYLGNGTLSLARHFIIPVFDNMPASSALSDTSCLADTIGQTGKISVSCNVRLGPSTSYSKYSFSLPAGTRVDIVESTRTDATYYLSVLKYPYWTKISFTYDGIKYIGYVFSEYVENISKAVYSIGTYDFSQRLSPSSSDDELKIISSDTSVASVSGRRLRFLKAGSVTLTAYSSCGGYDILNVLVNNTTASALAVSGTKVDASYTDSLLLSWGSVSSAYGYNVCVLDSNMTVLKSLDVRGTGCTVDSLPTGKKLYVAVRSYKLSSGVRTFGAYCRVACATRPDSVSGCTARTENGNAVLRWKALSGASGYAIYKYENNTYTYVGKTTARYFTLVGVPLEQAAMYRVRAYVSSGANYYGAISSFELDYSPLRVEKLTQRNTTLTGYTLVWDNIIDADGYNVYVSDGGSFRKLAGTTGCTYTVSGLNSASKAVYRVVGYCVNDGVYSYAEPSESCTAASLPDKPTDLVIKSKTSDSITVCWKAVSGEVKYEIVVLGADGEFSTYATLDNTEYTFKKFDGKTVCAVRAAVPTSSGKLCSARTETLALAFSTGKPSAPVCVSSEGGYTLSWGEVDGADGYELWEYKAELGTYVLSYSGSENSYIVFGAPKAETHKYRVRAYMTLTDGTKYSGYTENVSASAK